MNNQAARERISRDRVAALTQHQRKCIQTTVLRQQLMGHARAGQQHVKLLHRVSALLGTEEEMRGVDAKREMTDKTEQQHKRTMMDVRSAASKRSSAYEMFARNMRLSRCVNSAFKSMVRPSSCHPTQTQH
jgi:hypothetical protein